MEILRWDEVAREQLGEGVARRVVWGERATLARFEFRRGMHAARHQHEAEQHTCVISGALRIATCGREFVVLASEILLIPGNTEHEVWALEDSVVLVFFAPAREDWKQGDHHYLTGQSHA
ncbi:MAG: cupin domain-containing protein [Candidatus Acidiferrales bacterium]